jgi:hypothetical protein
MSSNYTCAATVVQTPEAVELGGKKCARLRLVDKAISKRHEDRFFNALLTSYDAETALRLETGDQILITGTLGVNSYKSKKTGQKVQSDEMGFGTRILRVLKSEKFFGGKAAEDNGDDEETQGDATAGVSPGSGPLDDLAF